MSFPYDRLHGKILPDTYHLTPLDTPLPSIQHLLQHIRSWPLPYLTTTVTEDDTTSPLLPFQQNFTALIKALQFPWPGVMDRQDTTFETAEEFVKRMELEKSKQQKLRFVNMLRDECPRLGVESMQELLWFVEGFAREMRLNLVEGRISQDGNSS